MRHAPVVVRQAHASVYQFRPRVNTIQHAAIATTVNTSVAGKRNTPKRSPMASLAQDQQSLPAMYSRETRAVIRNHYRVIADFWRAFRVTT